MKIRIAFFFLFSLLLLPSCEDPELDALMSDYCDCISESRYDRAKQIDCIEKMDEIRSKYQDDLKKMDEILEKTNECY